jgi:hypothetical protein
VSLALKKEAIDFSATCHELVEDAQAGQSESSQLGCNGEDHNPELM